jgi:hypothetical protein
MSKIEVDAIEPQSGTSLTLGASGDTITIPSGATLTNSGTATGFGKVLQVVTATVFTTEVTTTSTSYVTTGVNATITPSSASNKILILVNGTGENTSSSYNSVHTLFRGATDLDTKGSGLIQMYNSAGITRASLAISILDSPNTTSATTYTVYMKVTNAASTAKFGQTDSIITLIEIAG